MRRYDRIMQAISLVLSDGEIAAKHGTDSATIHVYRMVHDGTLPKVRRSDIQGQPLRRLGAGLRNHCRPAGEDD